VLRKEWFEPSIMAPATTTHDKYVLSKTCEDRPEALPRARSKHDPASRRKLKHAY
jgi:hypothetical protein